MQIVNIGTVYNLDDNSQTIHFRDAVGLVVISAAFPRYTMVSADGGTSPSIPLLRGHKVWLPCRTGYTITYPDTWAGNIDTSSYGNFDTFEPENPEAFEINAKGRFRAIIFQNAEEFNAYQVGRLEDVLFVPRLEGLNSGSELYSIHNMDFDLLTLMVKNVSNGYFNAFRVEEGNETNPADLDGFAQVNRIQLGYLTANYLTAANESNAGFLTITNVSSVRIHQIGSDVSAGSQRCYLYARFQDGNGMPNSGKRQGKNVLKTVFSCPNGATTNFDVPLLGANSWSLAIKNTGAGSVTSRVFRIMQDYDNTTVLDTSSDVIASGAHGAAAIRSANNWGHGGHDAVRLAVTNASGATVTMRVFLTSYI